MGPNRELEMSQLSPKQVAVLQMVCGAVKEAVEAAGPLGAPGGVLYAGMMSQGCTLQQFEGIMGGMVRAGILVKKGECYHLAG
jgi:hypothetical protein